MKSNLRKIEKFATISIRFPPSRFLVRVNISNLVREDSSFVRVPLNTLSPRWRFATNKLDSWPTKSIVENRLPVTYPKKLRPECLER